MADISFSIPAQIRFGLDVVNRIGTIISEYGERVLLVTEAILYEGKVIERIQGLLEKKGVQYIIFDEVVPNATSSVIDEGVTLARGAHAQVVIGLGGMRTLSVAKCIAMTAPEPGDIDDFLSGVRPKNKPLAYIEIPTTCRNPFMLVDEYLVTDSKDRVARIGQSQKNITRAVIVDPKLTVTLPAKYAATTIIDTLLAAVEGYISNRSNYLSDTFLAGAIELIGKTVKQAVEQPEDIRARINTSMAGVLTALGLTMSKQGIGAALAYAINGRFMVPKSWLSSILLPHVMEYNINSSAEKLARIGALMGEETEAESSVEKATSGIELMRRLIGSLGLPVRLRDCDLELDDMIDIVGTARSYDMMNYLPRTISTEDLYELVKTAY
ncbi:Lactaldehyde reductase [subsurface metagenome]